MDTSNTGLIKMAKTLPVYYGATDPHIEKARAAMNAGLRENTSLARLLTRSGIGGLASAGIYSGLAALLGGDKSGWAGAGGGAPGPPGPPAPDLKQPAYFSINLYQQVIRIPAFKGFHSLPKAIAFIVQ